tara:strand:- start:451 stop:1044 length:594 start_codon:yes stop_codon:yes gene_type:complete
MTVIFPGNYVSHLNAYKEQGVVALPGVEFYKLVGIAKVTSNLSGGGTLTLSIPSPDLRSDDKPRLDKSYIVPAGSTVYRTAIQVVNLKAAGTETVRVDGLTTTAGTEASLAAASGVFPTAGATTTFTGLDTDADNGSNVSAESSAKTITAVYSGTLSIVDTSEQAYVIVEVCYYKDAGAPDADDVHVGYQIEAGQSA